MKKSRGLLMIRFFALLIAVMLLIGSVPISAVIEQVEDSESASGVTETEETQAPSDEGDGDPAEAPQDDGGADDTQSEPAPVTSAPPVFVTAEKPDPVKEIVGQEIAPDVYFNYNADASLMVSGYDNVGIYKGLSVIEITYSGFDVTNPGEKARVVVTSIDDTTMPENFDEPNGTWGLQTDFVSQSFNSEQGKTTYTIYAQTAASMLLSKKDGTEGLRVWYTNDKYGAGNKLTYSDLLFYIDDEGPVVTVDEDAVDSTKWYRYSVTFPFTVEDAAGTLFAYISADKGDVFPDDDSNTVYTVEVTETPFTITAYDNLGNESTTTISKTVKIDEEEPQLTLVKNTDTWGNEQTFTVSVTDGDGNVDVNGFKLDGASVPASAAGNDTYEVKVTSSGSLTATDLAGRVSNAVTLTMNQDTAAPTADDIALKFFIRSEGEQQVLDVVEKTFNVHFNTLFSNAENVTMRVLVSRNSGSPITSITAKNGSVALEPVSNEILTDESGRDYMDFKIDLTDKDSAQKVYDDLRFEVKDSVYAALATTLNEIKTVHAKEEELPDPINEVVNTKITPEVTLLSDDASQTVTENGNLYAKLDSILKLNAEDKIGRLYRLKVYFDTADKFDAENGFKPVSGAKVITGDITQFTAAGYTVDEGGIAQYPADDEANTPKMLNFSYPITEELTGKYILYVEAQNYSLNIGTFVKEIYFDNSKPVISDVQYDKAWTNKPITLTFKAVDEPDGSAVGIDAVTVDNQPATYTDGKYTYDMTDRKHHVIKVTDKLGHSASKTINANTIPIDVNAPTVNSVSYNEELTNSNVVVTVTASDDLSGLKQVFAKNVSDPSDIFSAVAAEGQTEFKLTINTVGQNEYKVYAEDNAGNITPVEEAKTVVTKIDKSAIAVERVSFDGFVTGKVNGVYSNRNIIMSVKIKQSGLAVLASAKMGDAPVELSEDKLTARFTFPVGTKIAQIFENEFTFKNTSGTQATYKLKQFFTIDCEIVVSEEIKGDKDLFEIISTNASSTIYAITPKFNQIYTTEAGKRITDGANASFQFTISDEMSGIDMEKVQLTFTTPDGVRNIDVLNNDLNAEGETVTHTATMDLYGKVTEASFTFTISDRLETGSYSIKVNETNIAGNKAIERTYSFYVDADAPVISNVQYNTGWTNQPITLTFNVADKPDTNARGMGTVYVNGTLVEPKDGKYSYDMTNRSNYVIQVADAFGNQTSTTINAEDVPFDNTAPVVSEATCSDALTNGNVDVAVKVSDNLSGVKRVFAKNIANPEDIFSAEATEAGQTDFTLTVSTQGENTYNVYAEDNAGNITPVESAKPITTRIDKSKISIARVSFNKVETGTINGVYSNKAILMSVTIEQPEPKLAVLSAASMGTYPVELSEDKLTATFTFAAEDGGTTIKNLLSQILTLETTAGTKAMLTLSDLLSDSAQIVVDEATQGDQVLFEVIATEASSTISEITPVFRKRKTIGETLYADGVNGSLTFTVTDELRGVDMNSVVIMFGEEGNLVNAKDQGMVQSSVKSDKYGKITSAKFTCTLPPSLATGTYLMTIDEKNLAGNSAQKTYSFIIDTTSPEISDVVYDDKTWTDDPVTLTFNAVDKPDGSAVGMESVKINGEVIEGDNGKYTYSMTSRQDYTIVATDFFGNQSTYLIKAEDVPFDNTEPQVESVEYNTELTNTPVELKITVSDDLSGVVQVYAVNVKNPEDKFTVNADKDGQTEFNLTINTEGENKYRVYAVDGAGKVTELNDAKTITTKIDTSEIKIKKITFDGFVNGTPKGVYSNDDIFMSVYLDDTGIAVFDSAALDGYSSKITNKGKVAKFTMPVGGEGTKIENILTRVFTFQNTAGTKTTRTLKELLSEAVEIVYAQNVLDNPELIEIIATVAPSTISDVTPTFNDDNSKDEKATSYYSDGINGNFDFTITDPLSGIDTNSVKVCFGKTRSFGDTANLTDVTEQVEVKITKDKDYDKVVEAAYSYTLPAERLATGCYTLTIDEKNLSGNSATQSFSFYVDASAPVISNVSYNTAWTNEQIALDFNVVDQPKADAIGIASVTVNDVVVEGEHGVYSYFMTARQDYTIVATDVFGNKATYLIEAKDVPFDDTKPEITISPYNSKHTNQDVKITVNTSDDLSGIKMVYAENVKDSVDRFYGTAIVDQKKYELTITTQGNNTYNVYAVDNAGNISDLRTVNPKIDKSDIVIENVMFRQANGTETGAYSNKNILLEITIAQPFIATLSEAQMTVPADPEGGEDQVFTGKIQKDNLTARFTFPVPEDKDNSLRLANLLDYKFKLKNSASTEAEYTLTEFLSDGAEVSIGDDLKGDKKLFGELFEIVATKASSDISDIIPEFNRFKTRGGVYYSDGVNGKFTFSIDDTLSGIKMESIEVLFGETGSLEKIEIEPDNTDRDEYGKVVKADYTYTLPENLEVGYYTLTVNETNLSGNKATRSFDFYVDDSAPQIENIRYTVDGKDYDNKEWTNKPITVHFTVTEDPESHFIGIDSITVTGKTTGKEYTYTVDSISEDGLVYNCSFVIMYNEGFTIKATDQFEHSITYPVETPLQYDGDKPEITDFVYNDGVNDPSTEITEIDWARAEGGIEVTFDINDLSANHVGNTSQKDDNMATLSGLDLASVKVFAHIPDDPDPIEVLHSYKEDGDVYHFTFTAHYYATYTVSFEDYAHNENSATTATVKIDKDDPAFTGVTFERAGGANTILNILSFGLYSNDDYKMSVDVKDIAPSSGIGSVQAFVNSNELELVSTKWEPSEKDPDQAQSDVVGTAVFKIEKKTLSNDKNIEITVTDNAGNSVTKTLYELRHDSLTQALMDELRPLTTIDEYPEDGYEIVNTNEKPKIHSEIDLTGEGVYTDANGRRWFSAKNHPVLKAKFDISEEEAKLAYADITLNDNRVAGDTVSEAIGDEQAKLEDNMVHYVKKVISDTITFEPALAEYQHLNRTSQSTGSSSVNGGENKLTINVEANSGNKDSATEVFYVDDTAPVVTNVTFAGNGRADAYADTTGSYSADTVTRTPDADITDLKNYGFYFKDATTISVTATDYRTAAGEAINGSDVKEIHVIKMPLGDVSALSGEATDQVISNIIRNSDGSYTATFTIEANYKGKLYFYATDRVDNRSDNYHPDGTIVESLDKHNSTSSATIAVNSTPVAKDNNQHDLFNGSVSLKLTVSDTYSGIHTVSYNITSKWANGADLGSEKITIGQTDTSIAGWTIEEREANSNLITRVSKDITLDGTGIHNLNDIVIHLEATDRAGYEIKPQEDVTLSIDTTAPTIVLTPRDAVHNTYAPENKDYYQDTRVFDITVTERNFNPDDFVSASIITAREGEKPAIVGVSNWSTSYDDYTDTSTHTATISFETDGDYTVELNYKDEAGNAAESKKSDDFVIDKINPTISVSFNNNDARNGNYYKDSRIATVTVHEHNFAEGSDYISYSLSAFEGNHTTPRSEPMLATSGWSSNGDEHSTTLNFDQDGLYSFTINYSDKAKRAATEYREAEFIIDFKNTNGKIEFVVGYNNHAFGNQDVMPGVTFTDDNIDQTATYHTLTRVSYDPDNGTSDTKEVNDLIPAVTEPDAKTTKVVNYNDFPKEERYDGIYVLKAHLEDKAGNEFEESITFSVNRFGPTFMSADSNTQRVVTSGYTNDVPNIRVTEINVEEIKTHDVTFTRDTDKTRLQEGTNYKLTKSGSADTWYKYDFDVLKNNFDKEGNYTLTFTANLEYSDNNYNTSITNRTAKTDHGTYPVSFVYDNTAPDVTIEGVSDGSVHSEAEKDIKIICLDSNIDKDSLKITLNDKRLVLNTDYTIDDSLVGELDVDLPIAAGMDEKYYDLQVEVKDLANNGGSGEAKNFALSATFFTMFFHNTLAVVLTSVGLAALVGLAIFLILKKRKKQQE